MKVTTFREYEEAVGPTAIYPDRGSNLYYPALGLAGEVGEVCEKIKKIMRDKGGVLTEEDRHAIKKELGDVLWYLGSMSFEVGFSLEEVAQGNVEKLLSRLERGVLSGSGDNR